MDDDLRRRFEAVANAAPEGTPDVNAVQQRGRRHSYRRRALIALSTAACVALGTIGIAAVANREVPPQPMPEEAADADGVFTPAHKGEPTYLLSDFEINHPYVAVDHMPGMKRGSFKRQRYCSLRTRVRQCRPQRDVAGFTTEYRWATKIYPGRVQCRVRLFGDDGGLVGSETFDMDGREAHSRSPFTFGVEVSDRPVEAEAECEAGRGSSD